MKNQPFIRRLLFYCYLLSGLFLPGLALAQTVTISGPSGVCVGDVKVYTPSVTDPDLTYEWSVLPVGTGTVLSGNSTGATVQWSTAGPSSVNLTIRNPLTGNVVVYTGSLSVTVSSLPAPFITADIRLGCQPLNEDPREGDTKPEFDAENCQLVCENSTVKYTANGNPGSTYSWEVTGAISYTPIIGPTCDVTWGAPGFGEVKLIETTSSGCIAESFFCVEILQGPKALFEALPLGGTADPVEICLNGELVVQDFSTADPSSPIVSYLWQWGDGSETPMSPGAASTPMSHQYTSPGVYEVTLTVVNSCGCSNSFKRRVRVSDREAPKITCPRVVCEGERAVYTVDLPCDPSSWNVDGGTILSADPFRMEVVWDNVDPNTGFGYVYYTSCDPCRTTVVEPVPVVLKRAKIQGPDAICVGQQYVYRLPKWPSTEFNWYISGPAIIEPTDQRNEIAVTASGSGPGTITITCKYTNTVLRCGGDATKTIIIQPQVAISGPDRICQGIFASFNVGGASGNWILRDAANTIVATGAGPTFGYTFGTAGKYRVSVTGSSFCPPQDHLITVVGTPALPDLIIGPDRACANVPIRYDAGYPIAGTTFEWSVVGGGGGSASATVGDYSYITFNPSLPSNVQVVRVTTDGSFCRSGAVTKPVAVAIPPLSISGNTTVCHSSREDYLINYAEGDFYEWSVAPASLGSVVANVNTTNPRVLWNVPPGTGAWATLKGKVKKCGGYDSTTISVFVRGIPTFTVTGISPNDTVCSGTPVTVTLTPSFAVTSATSYTINWGDAPPVTTPGYTSTPSHTYVTAGSTIPVVYYPTIAINDANGCLGTSTVNVPPITVMPAPAAVLSPSGPLEHCGLGWSETLTATVTTGIGGSNSYAWSPAISTGTTGTATAYGGYNVTVTNSVFGCSATSNTVNIIQNCGGTGTGCGTAPSATLTPSIGNCGSISVSATVSGTYTSHAWVLPSGVTGGGPVGLLTATAAVAGEYTIRLRLYYGAGCYTDETVNVLVPYIPDLRNSISCNQSGGNYNITLFDHSSMYTTITSRTYFRAPATPIPSTMGGMQAVISQAPGTTETYYQVIQGGGMAACTSSVVVTTPFFPVVDIQLNSGSWNPGCVNDVVFNFDIVSMSGSIAGHYWNYIDATNYDPDGSIVYTGPGIRNVSLTVSDLYGCTATDNVLVDVRNNPYDGDISAAPNPVCQGSPVTLSYAPTLGGFTGITNYLWFEQATPVFSTSSPTYLVTTPGSYWVQTTGSFGCQVETTPPVSVVVNQIPAVSISGNTGQCINQQFTLTTQSYAGYIYSWSGAGTGTGTSLNQIKSAAGPYTYYVTITDPVTGCSRTSPPFTVTVSPPPAPPSLSFNILNCDPYELELTATGAAGTYTWSNGMDGSIINTPFGGGYQVTLTDLNGCTVQNEFDVPKSLEEYIWVFPTGCFCKPLDGAYVIGPIIPLSYWAWLRNGGVDVSGSGLMPNYSIFGGNVYNMLLDNGYCSLTSDDMYYESDTCRTIAGRPAGDNNPLGNGQLMSVDDANKMVLAPNPASIHTTVQYKFAKGSTKRSLELLDITGRRLQTFELDNESGELELPMHQYAAGMYQVLMRRDGVIVEQSKLSLTR